MEGGIASIIAAAVTHPLDLIKVRMQLQGEMTSSQRRPAFHSSIAAHGPIGLAWRLIQTEGIEGLYSGVSAAILRQVLYSSTRLGIYDILKMKWSNATDSGSVLLQKSVMSGLVAGAVGAIVGNPADIAMVRMQADGRLPLQERLNYRGVGDAIVSMVRKEGISSLWIGSAPTIQRAMLVTASQLASYDYFKFTIISNNILEDGISTHMVASFSAGFVASITSNPIDVVKTRLMSMKIRNGQRRPYNGSIDCALKTVRLEGPLALYKGFVPTVARQGPFAMVLFVSLEQIRKLLSDF